MTSVCTSGVWTTVVSVSVQRGAELLPAADGGCKEELWGWAAEEQWQGTHFYLWPPLLLFMQSPLFRLIFSPVPPSSGVLSAGEAPQCQPGMSELQWAEPAAAAFSPAAADHADWGRCSHLWTGGESEPAADTGKLETLSQIPDCHSCFYFKWFKWALLANTAVIVAKAKYKNW